MSNTPLYELVARQIAQAESHTETYEHDLELRHRMIVGLCSLIPKDKADEVSDMAADVANRFCREFDLPTSAKMEDNS